MILLYFTKTCGSYIYGVFLLRFSTANKKKDTFCWVFGNFEVLLYFFRQTWFSNRIVHCLCPYKICYTIMQAVLLELCFYKWYNWCIHICACNNQLYCSYLSWASLLLILRSPETLYYIICFYFTTASKRSLRCYITIA